MVSTNTIGFRVTLVSHMCFCSHGLSFFNLNQTSGGHCQEPQPTSQRYMWSTMVTLNYMVLEVTMLRLNIFMKSDFMFIKYLDTIMVSSNFSVSSISLKNKMLKYRGRCY